MSPVMANFCTSREPYSVASSAAVPLIEVEHADRIHLQAHQLMIRPRQEWSAPGRG